MQANVNDINRTIALAWLAGVLEGVGSFKRDHGRIVVSVLRPDSDTVERLKGLTGMGEVYGPRLRHGRKPQWLWTVSTPGETEKLLSLITPWLSPRRQQQLERLQKETDI